jgi:competence protein ComEC
MPRQNPNNLKSVFLKGTIFIFILITLFLGVYILQPSDNNLHVYFLNVGQGDSIYVRIGSDYDILVDGGPDNSVLSELGDVMPVWDREINLVILTHPHADHVAGLIDVLKRYKVDEIISNDSPATTSEYIEWLKLIKEKNIHLELVKSGDIKSINEKTTLKFLWPKESYLNKSVNDQNETSVVAKLQYNLFSVLLTGDINEDVEKEIMSKKENLTSNILKIPHHGSATGLHENFLRLINPNIAVVSVGEKNRFGHPAKPTLQKLEHFNIKILRTDTDGRIEIVSDGMKFWTKVEKE